MPLEVTLTSKYNMFMVDWPVLSFSFFIHLHYYAASPALVRLIVWTADYVYDDT